MQALEGERADRQPVAVTERHGRVHRAGRMRCDGGAGQADRLGVPLRVVGVPVGVDDVRDRQPLRAGALDQHRGRVGRIDQDALLRLPVAQQVAEVPVAADAHLLEHQLHARIMVRSESAPQNVS